MVSWSARYTNDYFGYLENERKAELWNIESTIWKQDEAVTAEQRQYICSANLLGNHMAKTLRGKAPSKAKPSRPQIVVFGAAGVGKTWTSLDFPNTYYIDVEGGANLPHYTAKLESVGAIYFGPEDGATDFDLVIDEIQTLATTEHDRKTLIIDSFSKLFNGDVQLEHDRIAAGGKEPAFGAEKKPAIAKMRRMVKWLGKLDMNVILICHEKPKWSDGEQAGYEPEAHSEISYDLNLVVQITRQGKTRKAKVVKTRFDSFREGELVDWSYTEFASRLGVDNLEAEFRSKAIATQAQCARMRELVDILAIDAKAIQKMFDKTGVTRWEEMTEAEIVKAIEFYGKKVPV